MFTGITIVRKLRLREVGLGVINDINYLLKKQHSEARRAGEESLRAFMKQAKVVVAWNDDERIVGLGSLIKTPALSHSFVVIYNLVVHEGYDQLSIGKRIVDLLIEGVGDVAFIEASARPNDDDLINLLAVCGFKPKQRLRYRLEIKPPKATPQR